MFSIQREVVEDHKRECNHQEQRVRSAQSRLEELKQAIERHIRKGQELHITMQRAEDHADELQDALDKETVKDGHLDVLQAALEEAEEEKRINESAYNDSVNAMEAIIRQLDETQQELLAQNTRISTLENEVQVAQGEAHIAMNKRRKILSDKNAMIERIEGMNHEKEKHDQKRTQITATIVDYTEKANMVSQRVAVGEGETSDSLGEKLDRLNKDLQRFNQQYVQLP